MFFSRKYILIVVALVVLVYGVFNPAHEQWFPRCPFYWITGWNCMLCGTQRATHELLHGHISASFAQNQWLWVTAPYWTVQMGWWWLPVRWQNQPIALQIKQIITHRYSTYTIALLAVIFMLWRNLSL